VPRVSVIIPTYQRCGLLDEALASVFSQTFADLEVIVVEDGSRTAGETLGKYGDRVRYVWQTNQGAGAARNTGAGMAQGEWLAFLDDDDLWLPTKLERQLEFACSHPATGVIHTDHFVRDEAGRLFPRRRRVSGPATLTGWVGREMFLCNSVVMSSALVKREKFASAGGFRASTPLMEDYELWLRMTRQCPFGFVAEALTIYRDHSGGKSLPGAAWDVTQMRLFETFIRDNPMVWEEYGRWTVRRRLGELTWTAAYACLKEQRYREARRLFGAAWRWEPWRVRPLAYGGASALGHRSVSAVRAIKRGLL
jgi:glycosyltransferase involved in cell wall biosynthesis